MASAAPASIVVVEVHRKLIEWNRAHLPERTSRTTADPRVRVVCADVGEWLDRDDGPWTFICLDIDNGPGWLMLPTNEAIYSDAGLARIGKRLGDRGVLAVWSADRSPAFEGALRHRFDDVATHEVRSLGARRTSSTLRGAHTRAFPEAHRPRDERVLSCDERATASGRGCVRRA